MATSFRQSSSSLSHTVASAQAPMLSRAAMLGRSIPSFRVLVSVQAALQERCKICRIGGRMAATSFAKAKIWGRGGRSPRCVISPVSANFWHTGNRTGEMLSSHGLEPVSPCNLNTDSLLEPTSGFFCACASDRIEVHLSRSESRDAPHC